MTSTCAFVTAGRDAEARLVELLGEINQDVADRVRLRLAIGLTVAEVEAARVADVRVISGAAFLTVRSSGSDRVRVLPLGSLYAAVIEPRARGGHAAHRMFPSVDAAVTICAFVHAAREFPGLCERAINEHIEYRRAAPKSSHARREAAFIAAGRMPPGFGWF